MIESGTTAIIEWDGTAWSETSGSIKHRIREALGFDKNEIMLMESSGTNGIAETVSFTVRGLGWFVDFTSGKVGRASQWDEADDNEADEG